MKNMTRKTLATLVAVFGLSTGALAAPPSAASVDKLMELTSTEVTVTAMYNFIQQAMRQELQRGIAGKTTTPEQRRQLEKVPDQFIAELKGQVDWAKIKPVFNQIYRDVFEQEEVDGLIAFYQSSAGKAYLTKMPQVIQKSTTLGQSQLQNIMPLAKAAVDKALVDAGVNK